MSDFDRKLHDVIEGFCPRCHIPLSHNGVCGKCGSQWAAEILPEPDQGGWDQFIWEKGPVREWGNCPPTDQGLGSASDQLEHSEQ